MTFPATREALEQAGYQRQRYARCRGCQASIEFWLTPAQKSIPMDFMADPHSPAISHFSTCPVAKEFRKK